MRRAHDPPALGRRWPRLRSQPQHQAGRARGLCGQCQLAARNEVELSRFAPDLQHDRAHGIAGQGVGGRPQRLFDIGSTDSHEKPRIETEFGKPVHRDCAGFDFGKILPDPDHRPARGHAACEACNKAARHGTLPASFRKHLMHGAQSEPALQVCVGLRMSERHLAQAIRRAVRLDALDAVA